MAAPVPVLIPGCALCVLAWHSYMRLPYQFVYASGEWITFQSVLRTVQVAFRDVRSVDARRWNRGFVTIRHESGSIHLLRNTPGIGGLVAEIQHSNPSAMVKGSV